MADKRIGDATDIAALVDTDRLPVSRVSGSTAYYATVAEIRTAAITPHDVASTTILAAHVELATSAETITGTDATRAVTPAGLAALTANSFAVVYNVTGQTGANWTVKIQAAIDAAVAAGGGAVYIPPSSTAYELVAAGDNANRAGYKYCLSITGDNVSLVIPRGQR